ncbi:MAG TPA: hypothetical protein VG276_07010 [Actinomycetes bacterium]|jgi:hypothetical protein|nr:hypothetical protein [Actinomycetes bacterium]
MVRGRVMPEEARAWSTGRLRSSEYFAWARRRAFTRAGDTIRTRLRELDGTAGHGEALPEPPRHR